MILEGCILIVLAVCALILTLAARNARAETDTETADGVITASDPQRKTVTVTYRLCGTEYAAEYPCDAYADAGEMPPVGLKVRISVNPAQPDRIVFLHLMREAGRGLGGRHAYIDNQGGKTRFTMAFLILMLFLAGIYCILNGLSIL